MIMRLKTVVVILAVCAVFGFATAPVSAEQRSLGSFQDWTAFADSVGGKQICYIGSLPKKQEGDYSRRDDTYILVTHRPSDKVFGEVSVEAGYTYKRGSEVSVSIDGKAYKLFTDGGNAWAYDVASDKAIVNGMRAGSKMIVKGTSTRGTLTTDTYSLSGFTAAFKAIDAECK
jgi:invasion protein IalB